MKKLFFALLAVAAIASCAKTEDTYSEGQSEIKMAPVTSYVTKAPVYNAIDGIKYPKAEEFGVWAYWDGDAAEPNKVYLENKVFANKGIYWAGKDDTYYWPKNGNLRFSCYSPADIEGVSHYPDTDTFVVDYKQSSNTATTVDFILFTLCPIQGKYDLFQGRERMTYWQLRERL